MAAGLPLLTHANAGIGLFTPASITLVVALIPVVLLEAAILRWRLQLAWRRAFVLALCANVASTLAGAAIGLALDFTVGALTGIMGSAGAEGFVVSLVLMFGITLWLERGVLRRMEPAREAKAITRAALWANAASYLLLVLAVAALVGPDRMRDRAKVYQALNGIAVARREAEDYFAIHGSFQARSHDVALPHARRVTVDEAGRIVAEVVNTGNPEIDGARIVQLPLVGNGKIVDWRCHVPVGNLEYFPPGCRHRTPEAAFEAPDHRSRALGGSGR